MIQITINGEPATEYEVDIVTKALLHYHTSFVNKSTTKRNHVQKPKTYLQMQQIERKQAAFKEQANEVYQLIEKL